jgi:hypothetical protein
VPQQQSRHTVIVHPVSVPAVTRGPARVSHHFGVGVGVPSAVRTPSPSPPTCNPAGPTRPHGSATAGSPGRHQAPSPERAAAPAMCPNSGAPASSRAMYDLEEQPANDSPPPSQPNGGCCPGCGSLPVSPSATTLA